LKHSIPNEYGIREAVFEKLTPYYCGMRTMFRDFLKARHKTWQLNCSEHPHDKSSKGE